MVCLTSESGCGKRGKEEISGLFFSVSRTNRSGFKNTHNGRHKQRPPVIWNKRDIHPPDNRRLGKLEILEAERRDSLFFFYRASFFAASPSLLCSPNAACCIQLSIACSQWPSGGSFHSWGPTQCYCCQAKGKRRTMGFQKNKKKEKALVPPHWLTHRCDVEST